MPATIRRTASVLNRLHAHLLAVFAVLAVAVCAAPARAGDTITSWASEIAVDPTGNISVTELLDIRVEGNEIKHGIFRNISMPAGATLEVLTVKRDDQPEPFVVEPNGAVSRIKIGDGKVLVDPGRHRYAIAYMVKGAVPGPEFDWDVTGSWSLPIDMVSARVVGPSQARIESATGKIVCVCDVPPAVEAAMSGDHVANFTTAHNFAPHEQLTISLRFGTAVKRGKLDH